LQGRTGSIIARHGLPARLCPYRYCTYVCRARRRQIRSDLPPTACGLLKVPSLQTEPTNLQLASGSLVPLPIFPLRALHALRSLATSPFAGSLPYSPVSAARHPAICSLQSSSSLTWLQSRSAISSLKQEQEQQRSIEGHASCPLVALSLLYKEQTSRSWFGITECFFPSIRPNGREAGDGLRHLGRRWRGRWWMVYSCAPMQAGEPGRHMPSFPQT
jgi:hypothetical protein